VRQTDVSRDTQLCRTAKSEQACQMAYFQKKIDKLLAGLAMEDVGLFYGHLVYYTAIWYILLPFGIFFIF
jgi:hypothetical protein